MEPRFKISIVHPDGQLSAFMVPVPDDAGMLVRMGLLSEVMNNVSALLPRGAVAYLTVKSKANECAR